MSALEADSFLLSPRGSSEAEAENTGKCLFRGSHEEIRVVLLAGAGPRKPWEPSVSELNTDVCRAPTEPPAPGGAEAGALRQTSMASAPGELDVG